jgi:hypothetical protein
VIEEPVEPAVEAMDQIGDPDGDVIVEIEAAPAFVEAEDAIFADVENIKPGPSATDLAVAEALGLSPQPASFEVVVDDGGLSTSPRPRVRPADRRTASISSVLSEVTGEIDATSIPAGTRLVQLGAYGSADVARTEWAGVMAEFGDYMVGKDRVVQEAQSGGRTFWRLRAMGFDDLADARRFCSVLVAEGANCIPVVQE